MKEFLPLFATIPSEQHQGKKKKERNKIRIIRVEINNISQLVQQ